MDGLANTSFVHYVYVFCSSSSRCHELAWLEGAWGEEGFGDRALLALDEGVQRIN